MIVLKFFEGTGCILETAETGAQAVERHVEDPYDLILMDCHMPDMDGFEATKAIRALACGNDTPIVAVTASALPEDRERCRRAGMTAYVSKPLRRDELWQAIALAINREEAVPLTVREPVRLLSPPAGS
jgi:CheY-like chemotaxis protein